MPRRAPDQVYEQRVTLGTLERQLVSEVQDAVNATADLRRAQNFKAYAEGVAALTVPVVIGGAVVLGAHVYSEAKTMIDGLARSPMDVPLRIVRNPDPDKPDLSVTPRQLFSISPLRFITGTWRGPRS